MARLVFLGRLAEAAGVTELAVALPGRCDFSGILAQVDPTLADALRDERIRVAINGVLTPRDDVLAELDDEVAFLPPVSGG